MQNIILSQQFADIKGQLDELVKQIHELSIEIKNESLITIVSELRNRVNDPFMFVICGEVKVGKSSFINALLNTTQEICKVAVHPMTDTIQQILYGEEFKIVPLSPVLKRIYYPEEILKEIAIVDTPGTNTIIQHHQEITEKFIPNSDLVVFVFEAKNPYRQSAWDLFQYINEEWKKKVIFVLQQKDLINDVDLKTNIEGLRSFAKEKGVTHPIIFSVSAKMELEEKKQESGFDELRNYILEHITGGKAAIYKLLNNLNTADQITLRIDQGIKLREEQYRYDREFRKEIQETLDKQEVNSKSHIDLLNKSILAGYDSTCFKFKEELDRNISFFSVLKRGFLGIFNKSDNLQNWLTEFSTRFEQEISTSMRSNMDTGVHNLSESIHQMSQILLLKISQSKTILKNDHELFSEIAKNRSNVMSELIQTIHDFTNNPSNYIPNDYSKISSSLAPNVTTGTGIAIIGAIITAITHGAVFDITGGVMTTLGLAFAGISLGFNKRKIINKFDQGVSDARTLFTEQIHNKLNQYVNSIKSKLEINFDKFDQHLAEEQTAINKLNQSKHQIQQSISQLQNEIVSKTGLEPLQ